MAKNRVTRIDNEFEAPVPTGTKSGDPVLAYGVIPTVAQTSEGAGVGNIPGRASVTTEGIFALPVADAVTKEGTPIYASGDGTTPTTLTTSTGGVLFGHTIHMPDPEARTGGTKTAGAGTVNIRLAKV